MVGVPRRIVIESKACSNIGVECPAIVGKGARLHQCSMKIESSRERDLGKWSVRGKTGVV
jgi:hypothetical protein